MTQETEEWNMEAAIAADDAAAESAANKDRDWLIYDREATIGFVEAAGAAATPEELEAAASAARSLRAYKAADTRKLNEEQTILAKEVSRTIGFDNYGVDPKLLTEFTRRDTNIDALHTYANDIAPVWEKLTQHLDTILPQNREPMLIALQAQMGWASNDPSEQALVALITKNNIPYGTETSFTMESLGVTAEMLGVSQETLLIAAKNAANAYKALKSKPAAQLEDPAADAAISENTPEPAASKHS